MVDSEHIPAVLVNILERAQLLLRISQITDARLIVDILERVDAPSLAFLATNDTARLQGCIRAGEGNQLLKLFACQLHCDLSSKPARPHPNREPVFIRLLSFMDNLTVHDGVVHLRG
jgi:hypothetical protein